MQSFYQTLRNAGALAIIAALGGCATIPHLGTAPVIRPASVLAADRTLAAGTAQWPTDKWWLVYNDAQMTALIEGALAGSPSLAIAQARFRAADATLRQARAAQLPQLGARAAAGIAKQSYNNGIPAEFVPRGWNETGSASLSLGHDLDLWGGKRAGTRTALSESEAAALEIEQARLVLATGIAAAYAQLTALSAARTVAEAAVTLRSDTEALVRSRVANGVDTEVELAQAQAAVPAARGDVLAIDEAIIIVRHQIAALLGKGPDDGLDITIGKAPLAMHDLPAGVTTDLIGRRPDIRAARARVEASAGRIGQARAGFYPSVNISSLIGYQALGFGNVFALGSSFGNAGAAISLPIFDGGVIAGRYRQARAGHDEAVAIYDRVVVDAFREVADAAATRQSLTRRLGEARAAAAQAERGYAIARQRYEGGLSAYLEVLAAGQAVLAARRTRVDLESRGFVLDVALVRALGGGLSPVSAASSAG